jgi:hypothetical protein
LFAHVEPLDEVRRHADLAELHEQIFGDAVVEDAFALDLVVLLVVEGCRVVLEVLDERTLLRAFVQNLGLAFVDTAAPVHVTFLSLLRPSELTAPPARGKQNARTAPLADCSSAESTQVEDDLNVRTREKQRSLMEAPPAFRDLLIFDPPGAIPRPGREVNFLDFWCFRGAFGCPVRRCAAHDHV